MFPVGAIFVPFPPKTGTNMLHPRPPAIVELVYPQAKSPGGNVGISIEFCCAVQIRTILSVISVIALMGYQETQVGEAMVTLPLGLAT